MSYTKAQLEARVQTLSEVLEAFDIAHFERMWFTQQWTRDYRQELYNKLVAARKALAEAEAEEDAVSKANEFDLLLADEKRKAYDLGDSQGYSKGYNTGYDWGKKDGKVLGYAEGYDQGKAEGQVIGYDEGYDEGWDDGYSSARKFWKPED